MNLTLHPHPGGFGARADHDLTTPAIREIADDLRAALTRHRLLILPGQHLNHADLLAAAGLFGTLDTDVDRRYAVPGFPGITVISNITEHGAPVGIYDGDDEEEWHADNSFKPRLTRATLLYSVIAPGRGGETRFADATRAYTDLPQNLKDRIDGLSAVHSITQLGARQSQAAHGRSSAAAGTLTTLPEAEHPLAPPHPVTGARTLLLGPMVIRRITGLPDDEGRALHDQLLQHTTSTPYLYRHRWTQGDLVVWDNLATLHTASPCDSTRHHRLLYRATIH
ncbi:TauD/TfdA dioxygenase family protein [Streptomyces yaizuensis]|uniref:TauD/TfdA family dioxygenase n=1 Tax=Streptomyces yaizuensis TaxID=2989713 RepID=A0ABQ5P778_9ACTN|nr:TauD/TfdA family dioxygenase [Streptomyces sp. YSPA8]GLF98091.1 TauD/TfdA family dioxygenase [Streptomyces sp. YSPA8]